MEIKRVRARRFLSFGEEWADIDFTKLGRIVTINGINKDYGEGHSNGSGKCFGAKVPILMYDGSTKIASHIRIGDILMGDDSKPRKVLSLSRGRENMYKVVPVKGMAYEVNESHILALKSSDKTTGRPKTPYRQGNSIFIPVREYLKQNKNFKHLTRGYRAKVDWIKQEVKIDPYILGIWLGDGTKNKAEITNIDNEIISAWYEESQKRGMGINKNKCHYHMTCGPGSRSNNFLNDLRHYNLFDNKHIPKNYLINDRDTRLKLLAGLMDTDGDLSKNCYSITQKCPVLSEQIVFLARSLGFCCYLKKRLAKSQNGTIGVYHRISICGHTNEIPCKVEYKKAKIRKQEKDPLVVGIKLEPLGEGDYYGFEVDGNHRFLLSDFTVVHNSSTLEMIVYGLYGKLLKGLNRKAANNIYFKRGLEIEIWVDDMFIRRTNNPDSLIVEIDGQPAEMGGKISTQEEINRRLRLNYDGFVNVSMFGQHSLNGFLEAKAEDKRRIAENLLGLDDYARYHEIAKKQKTFLSDAIKELGVQHDNLFENVNRAISRIMTLKAQQSQWIKGRTAEIDEIKKRIISIQGEIKDLSNSDIDQETCHKELERIDTNIKTKEKRRTELLSLLKECEPKVELLRQEFENFSVELSKTQARLSVIQQSHKKKKIEIDEVENSKGMRCPTCKGSVKEENIVLMTENLRKEFVESSKMVETLKSQTEQGKARLDDLSVRYDRASKARTKVRQEESSILSQISSLMQERLIYTKPPATAREAVLVKESEILAQRSNSLLKELEQGDPFKNLILAAESEVEDTKNKAEEVRVEISHKDKLLPYYEYWVRGFGDKGIRSFLFEEKLPVLNYRINHWLQILIDNKLKLTFDRDLVDTIRRVPDDNKKFVYNSLSGGELKRIDLAISQAFAYVTMISSGSCPSILALDEVAANIDRVGMFSIYKMIQELSRDRQVLVITHDPDLLEFLQHADSITAEMSNGITSLKFIYNNS